MHKPRRRKSYNKGPRMMLMATNAGTLAERTDLSHPLIPDSIKCLLSVRIFRTLALYIGRGLH